ncbi:MAG: metal ABC transporter solute-binding protein, Zn/Mn family, partial [Planctomycetia bacterium]
MRDGKKKESVGDGPSRRGLGRRLAFLGLLLAVGAPIGCTESEGVGATAVPPSGGRVLKVLATTGMVADVVRRVGGAHVAVTALFGPGVDPHLYKASPGDVAALSAADVVVYNGLHLEGKMADLFHRLAKKKKTLALGEA